MRRALPRPLADERSLPIAIEEGLWSFERTLVHFGFARLPSRTTIVRLASGGLVVVSPPADPSAAALETIASLGPVEHVVVPNSFHYVFTGPFLQAHPGARLWIPPGLAERAPELPAATGIEDGTPLPDSNGVEAIVLGPVHGLAEVLLFHRPTATLILTDLAFNMNHHVRAIDRVFWRLSGIPARFAPGRTSRGLLLRDHSIANAALTRTLEWPFERIVPAHGDVLERDARARFEAAFAAYL